MNGELLKHLGPEISKIVEELEEWGVYVDIHKEGPDEPHIVRVSSLDRAIDNASVYTEDELRVYLLGVSRGIELGVSISNE